MRSPDVGGHTGNGAAFLYNPTVVGFGDGSEQVHGFVATTDTREGEFFAIHRSKQHGYETGASNCNCSRTTICKLEPGQSSFLLGCARQLTTPSSDQCRLGALVFGRNLRLKRLRAGRLEAAHLRLAQCRSQ